MKKVLIFLVLVFFAATDVAAQKYYIPRFKKTKIERDYTLENTKHKLAITLGASFNACLGMQNTVKYGERGDNVTYNESMSVAGGSFSLGVGYRFNENFITTLESGFQLQGNSNAVPLYASFKYYYGKAVQRKRYRWFNYLNAGPQFFLSDSSKGVGGMVAAGVGLRVLAGKTMKMDIYLGYQLNVRQRVPAWGGRYDIPASDIRFNQLAHLIQVGVNIPLW